MVMVIRSETGTSCSAGGDLNVSRSRFVASRLPASVAKVGLVLAAGLRGRWRRGVTSCLWLCPGSCRRRA